MHGRKQDADHPETLRVLERTQALHSKVLSHLIDKEHQPMSTKSLQTSQTPLCTILCIPSWDIPMVNSMIISHKKVCMYLNHSI